LTSVGVCWPEKASDRFNRRSTVSFRTPPTTIAILTCSNCEAVVFEDSLKCPVCLAEGEVVKQFIGWRPESYVADVKQKEKYNGNLFNAPISIKVFPSPLEGLPTSYRSMKNFEIDGF